jgi:hypothetical protein
LSSNAAEELIILPSDLLQNRRVLSQMIQASSDTERLWQLKKHENFAERSLEVLGRRKSPIQMNYFFNYFSSENWVCGFEASWNLERLESKIEVPYTCFPVESALHR